jgi:hypothetical protein
LWLRPLITAEKPAASSEVWVVEDAQDAELVRPGVHMDEQSGREAEDDRS